MNVAFLANSFHLKKTHSADFFIALLRDTFGTVDVIPHKDAWAELPKRRWDLIVVWQHRYPPEELEAFGADRVVLVPMYDDTPLDKSFWSQYKQFKVFCFSSTLERLLVSYGLQAWGLRYYPDPADFPRADSSDGLRGFFWPRTRAIDWSLVKKLVGETPFEKMHLHWTPDLHGDLPPPLDEAEKSSGRIEVSSWFADSAEYRAALGKATVFFAPRAAEGIGMSFLEAMAMGLCVVAPNAPTMNEYITDGVNGLLYDPANPKPLDFSRVKELGAAARRSCEIGRSAWLEALPRIVSFLEEGVVGYRPTVHPLIAAKGRGIAAARRVYRFVKRVARKDRPTFGEYTRIAWRKLYKATHPPLLDIATLYTEVPLAPARIPRRVYQTWKEPRLPAVHAAAIKRFRKLNYDCSFAFFDDAAMVDYMRTNYAGHPILPVFERIKIPASKADIWRYCILYREGGIYCDIDSSLSIPLRDLLKDDPSEVISFENGLWSALMAPGAYADSSVFLTQPPAAAASQLDYPNNTILNWLLCFEKGHPILAEVIDLIVRDFHFFDGKNFDSVWQAVIHATGPLALTQAIWRWMEKTGQKPFQRGIYFEGRGVFKIPGSGDRYTVSTNYYELKKTSLTILP